MLASLQALWRYRDLLRHLVLRDLHVKYKGSTLGFAWSLLHPLLLVVVYTAAFRMVLRVQIERFPLFLVTGLLPWTFLASSLSIATSAVADNGGLIRKVAFPRLVLPIAAVMSQLIQFLLMYSVIVPLMPVLGAPLSPALLAIPPVVFLQLLFTAGLSLVLATAYVYFRDTRHLLEVAIQVWFWLTPVVYSVAMVPEPYRWWLSFNPMALFVTAYQDLVLHQALPSPPAMTGMIVAAALSATIGLMVFSHHQRRFAELV